MGYIPRDMANRDLTVEWDEREVVRAFCRSLESEAWITQIEQDYVDVVAHRADQTILAKVKGRTNRRPAAGANTLDGQLLRRMPPDEVGEPMSRFAVVVPTGVEPAAFASRGELEARRIDIYAVSDNGQVERLDD